MGRGGAGCCPLRRVPNVGVRCRLGQGREPGAQAPRTAADTSPSSATQQPGDRQQVREPSQVYFPCCGMWVRNFIGILSDAHAPAKSAVYALREQPQLLVRPL